MAFQNLRAAVVGASSLLGRELSERLAEAEPGWQLTLIDEEQAAGQVTAAGDEPLVVQALVPGVFSGADLVFFASDGATAVTHWPEVQRAGAVVVDLTGALAGEPGMVTSSPWLRDASPAEPSLETAGVVAAHPAALVLALLATQLRSVMEGAALVATVLQPASSFGKAGVDELHAQTAALLTFQTVPREQFDAQVAFNLVREFGAEAKFTLRSEADRVRREYATLAPSAPLALQLLQAPVFHGLTASVYIGLPNGDADARVVRSALGGVLHVASAEDELPSNQAAVESGRVLVSIAADPSGGTNGLWLWLAADNLRLAAEHALACAQQLARLRAPGVVQ